MKNTISIVTICFNNLEDVQKTCASVDKQEAQPYEHWIINGSTTDDIKNWLESNPQPPYRRWINERDKGIADAFNKGVKHSLGDIIYLLNSGDELYDATILDKILAAFEKDENLMWCHGKLKMFRGNEWVIIGKPFEKEKLYRGMRSVFHPTMYVKREVYERRGLYDVTVKIAMDYDFLCRIADEEFAFIDYPLAVFDPTGVSSSKYLDGVRESFECYQKYYGFSFKQKIWYLRLSLLHYLLQTRLGKFLYKAKVKAGAENL
jgi:glycosyltransferase involved in cell wall biosynthesis